MFSGKEFMDMLEKSANERRNRALEYEGGVGQMHLDKRKHLRNIIQAAEALLDLEDNDDWYEGIFNITTSIEEIETLDDYLYQLSPTTEEV